MLFLIYRVRVKRVQLAYCVDVVKGLSYSCQYAADICVDTSCAEVQLVSRRCCHPERKSTGAGPLLFIT